jgi:hypothetical protein
MAQLSPFDEAICLAAYKALDTEHVADRLCAALVAIWRQPNSRKHACNILRQYTAHHVRGALNLDMHIKQVIAVVFDVMLVRAADWTHAQMVSAVGLAFNIMNALSVRLETQLELDSASAEERAMKKIMAARLAAEAQDMLAAERAGMTWEEWPPEEAWDARY